MENDDNQNYGKNDHNSQNNPDGFDIKKSKLNKNPSQDLYKHNEGFPSYEKDNNLDNSLSNYDDDKKNTEQEGYVDDTDFGNKDKLDHTNLENNTDLYDNKTEDDDLEKEEDINEIEGEINSNDEKNPDEKNGYYLGGKQCSYYSVYDL